MIMTIYAFEDLNRICNAIPPIYSIQVNDRDKYPVCDNLWDSLSLLAAFCLRYLAID